MKFIQLNRSYSRILPINILNFLIKLMIIKLRLKFLIIVACKFSHQNFIFFFLHLRDLGLQLILFLFRSINFLPEPEVIRSCFSNMLLITLGLLPHSGLTEHKNIAKVSVAINIITTSTRFVFS